MASNKKKINKLSKRLKKTQSRVEKLAQQISRLGSQLAQQDDQAQQLQSNQQQGVDTSHDLPAGEAIDLDIYPDEVSQEVLRKAAFLRDRYEFHLEQDKPKPLAREAANADLVAQYGEESGFTQQELEDVLS